MEDVQIDRVEPAVRVPGVDVDRTDERTVVDERHRDHPGDPLALDECGIAHGRALQVDLDVLIEAAVDLARALHGDPLRAGVGGAQALRRHDPERVAGVVGEHDRGGIRRFETARRPHDLRQQPVELEDAQHRGRDALEDADALGHAA